MIVLKQVLCNFVWCYVENRT